jgi:heptosyltransferase-2
VLGTGSERDEWPAGNEFGPLANLCGLTTLRQAAGVIRGAEFVVAIDNGLAHIAAALEVPVFVLFGATGEAAHRPWGKSVHVITSGCPCRPCEGDSRWSQCRDWRCMNDISAEAVWRAIVAANVTQRNGGEL